MKRKIQRAASMPLQKNTNRFYYPLSQIPTEIGGAKAQNLQNEELKNAFFDPYSDPEGSYTGIPRDGGVPTQDADDL